MPSSRRILVVILPLLLAATMILAWPWPHEAQAEIWKWRQSDWSGGSGQASFGGYAIGDPTMYNTSTILDTKGRPGSLRLSYLANAFTKAAGNPVIAAGGAGSWDEQGAVATDLRPLGDGYEAFYMGWDAGGTNSIGRATSTNGTNWTKTAENPLIGAGSWNPRGSEIGPILMENDTYCMWFAAGSTEGFGYAESVDGIANDWYFAEGYTGSDFENWLTIENPNAAAAHLQITYYTRDAGALPVRNHTVPANSLYTIYINQDAGTNLEVSTFVHSADQPVLCERPMNFNYRGLGDYDWGGVRDVVGFSP